MVDSSGNIYAAGYQNGQGTFDYGDGVTSTGKNTNYNVVLVKYDSSGIAQWAETVATGPGYSRFYDVAADSSGNVYAAGEQYGNGTFTYGGESIAGDSNSNNLVLVKYNNSGTVQWARTVDSAGNEQSQFYGVTVDSSDNIYAAGKQWGTDTFTYGTGVSSSGTNCGGLNITLVKYDSSGSALWARTVSSGADNSVFNGVAAGSSGVFAGGQQYGTGEYRYGSGIYPDGTGILATGIYGTNNAVLVKYPK